MEDAIQKEADYVNSLVWVGVPVEKAVQEQDFQHVSCRICVSTTKDSSNADVRAQLATQDCNIAEHAAAVAATPPVKANRMLFGNSRPSASDGKTIETQRC